MDDKSEALKFIVEYIQEIRRRLIELKFKHCCLDAEALAHYTEKAEEDIRMFLDIAVRWNLYFGKDIDGRYYLKW